MKKHIKIISFLLAFVFITTVFTLAACNNVSTETSASSYVQTYQTSKDETTGKTVETDVTKETTIPPIINQTTYAETTEKIVIVDPNLRTYTISEEEIYDKIKAGWLGEMIGVGWAGRTEFHFVHRMMQDSEMYSTYAWQDGMFTTAYEQDDLYVEIPFLKAVYKYGYDCDMYYIGREYRYSSFTVWHANDAGRSNLIQGAIWPESGSYVGNTHADDIDWQIDADYLGMMYPGLANYAATKSFDVGHFVNYGDGVYGGVFVAAMHACAFTAKSIDEIVQAGISVIPKGTQFREVVDSVYEYYKAGKTRQETWQMLENRWAYDDTCSKYNNQSANIDAKLNAAYVLIGLLYGEGDFEKTIVAATSCGQDSDCNPSTAASILGNFYGTKGINLKFLNNVDYDKKFSYTDVSLGDAIQMNYTLALEILENNPFANNNGDGTWTISVNDEYEPVEYEQWPQGFYVNVKAIPVGNNVYSFSYRAENGEVQALNIETGDGYECSDYLSGYRYKDLGEYKFKAKFTSTKGETFTVEKTIYVNSTNYEIQGKAISSCDNPTGSGNKNVYVILDGSVPVAGKSNNNDSYDTNDGKPHDFAYVGMEFDYPCVLDEVIFIEGKHYTKGGWFAEEPYIEVLIDGTWQKVGCKLDRDYPENDRKSQGDEFEVFIFWLDEKVKCSGFRVCGVPGGQGTFISCGELVPVVSSVDYPNDYFDKYDDAIITNLSYPNGSGNKDINVIRDGNKKGSTSLDQYDTYSSYEKYDEVYVGYIFNKAKKVSSISYTTGMMFDGGGWFKDANIKVEALIDGQWVDVKITNTPNYPSSNNKGDFKSFEEYVFSFDEINCYGIRLSGTPGGSEKFISICELEYT